MKKIISILLAALLIVALLPIGVLADEAAASATDLAKVKVYYGEKNPLPSL